MSNWNTAPTKKTTTRLGKDAKTSSPTTTWLKITDVGLLGIIFVAPLFLGGRHPLGRLVFIGLACVTAVAWFIHQASTQEAKWVRTKANLLGLAAIFLVAFQLIPLPFNWLAWLTPRNLELIPLWSNTPAGGLQLGQWKTISLSPGATRVALATAIAYLLLFVTVTQRLQSLSDIRKLFQALAISAVGLSLFGLVQYFGSNGLFFWFYEHPYSTTIRTAKASFSCSNHFAHFVVLGGSALLGWTVWHINLNRPSTTKKFRGQSDSVRKNSLLVVFAAGLSLVVLAVLWSESRGGALGLAIAGTTSVLGYYRRGLVSGSFLYGIAFLGLAVIGFLSLHGYDKVAVQLDDFASGSISTLDNDAGRRKIWQANLSAISEGGLLGAGAGTHREIYPAYLSEFVNVDYTHAENGYLQIGSETGFLGLSLLLLALTAVCSWCWRALRQASSQEHQILAIVVTAALLANAVHSLADFVWFIPACMSLTIMLAAAALRLAQLVPASSERKQPLATWQRGQWLSMCLASGLAAIWCFTTMSGPGLAAVHWDSFQLSAIASKQKTSEQLTNNDGDADRAANTIRERQALTEAAIYHLQNVLTRNPNSARAHLQLSKFYLTQFEQRQQNSENPMSLDQIRDTVISNKFKSSRELSAWLTRAFGDNRQRLYQAHYHSRRALELCPLLGRGYLNLSKLCFLGGHGAEAMKIYARHGESCRPYDEGLLYEIGRQHWMLNQYDEAISVWQRIYPYPGLHQLNIATLLTRLLPAEIYVQNFNADLKTLRYVWEQYLLQLRYNDCQLLVQHAITQAKQEESGQSRSDSAQNWLSLSVMQRKLLDQEGCLTSLRRAEHFSPSNYAIKRQLGKQLVRVELYQQAQPYLRWCLARQPDDSQLRRELTEANKRRLTSVATASNLNQTPK